MFNASMSSWRHRPVEKEIASRLNTKEGQFTELTCLTSQILVKHLLDHSVEVPVLFLEYRKVAKKKPVSNGSKIMSIRCAVCGETVFILVLMQINSKFYP